MSSRRSRKAGRDGQAGRANQSGNRGHPGKQWTGHRPSGKPWAQGRTHDRFGQGKHGPRGGRGARRDNRADNQHARDERYGRRRTPREERESRARLAGTSTKQKLAVICDFDGTITREDVAEAILRRFTGDAWLKFEDEYRAGKIGSREALQKQFALVKAPKSEIVKVALQNAKITPGFKEFAALCERRHVPLVVLSEGLDFYIERILTAAGLEVEWHSNIARFSENGLQVECLDNGEECDSCGNCKLGRLTEFRKRGWEILYIGDGHSDLCPAREADRVLAKGRLLAELRRLGKRCERFEDFRDCARYLEGLM